MNHVYGGASRSGLSPGGGVPEPGGDYEDADSWGPADDRSRGRSGRRAGRAGRWRGAGGRWWVWAGRVILWAFILVVLVNGIRASFERYTANESADPAVTATDGRARFPASAASAFALQFTGVYLNYDQKTASDRERQLRFFVPDGADGQFGWNGTGALRLQSVQVASVDARDANNAIVTLLAKTPERWFQLAVPIYAKDGAMVVSGRPALLPPPPRATLPETAGRERDTALEAELQQPLEGFFKSYGSGDTVALSRYADRNSITGLGGSVAFVRLKEVIAPTGGADQRDITVTVGWQIPTSDPKMVPGELEQTYELTVVRKDGAWYVRDIDGSTRPTGS
ncbi:hypothetical protein GCM10009780_09610 [Actinomadura alba]